MKRTILICCAAYCLTGCDTYQKYSRPQVINADNLFGDDIEQTDTSSISSIDWRTFFTDGKLRPLIERGLENNADLRIAALRVKEAEATLQSSRLAYLPSLSLNPQGTSSSYGGGKPANTYSLSLSTEWELDIAGKLTNEKRQAQATAYMYEAAHRAVQTQLIATIANSYYSLLMLDAQLDISRRTLESWEETLRTLQLQKQTGETTEAAVAQAQANMLAVESSILSLQKQIKAQENSLSVLLGSTAGKIERNTLSAQTFPDTLAIGVPLQLLERRPDIRQAEHSLQAAFYATNSAKAAFYPQLTLSGTLGWTNSDGSSIANPGKWLTNAIGQLTQPLFNRGKNIANRTIAEARQEEAAVAFQQKLLQAGTEVNDALTQWQTARSLLRIDSERISALKEAVRSTRLLLLHSGESSYLEVLTAQQALLQAELTETQDIFAKIQGVVNLYHALGGGTK